MSRIKLFTHTDLDGVGCAIVALQILGNVDIEYCDYNNINQRVSYFIESSEKSMYRHTYITDISVNPEVAERIEKVKGFTLLDHHKTAEWLNRYTWAKVLVTHDDGRNASGTSLLFEFLDPQVAINDSLTVLVEKIRRYDTWEWLSVHHDHYAKELNDLLYILGRERFIHRFMTRPILDFDVTERLLLQLDSEKAQEYTESKIHELIIRKISGHFIGIVFAERYYSELSNRLPFEYPNVDFIAIINPSRSVSYRGLDKVDVGLFAKQYGGGGHRNAAGSPITPAMRDDIIDAILKEAQYEQRK